MSGSPLKGKTIKWFGKDYTIDEHGYANIGNVQLYLAKVVKAYGGGYAIHIWVNKTNKEGVYIGGVEGGTVPLCLRKVKRRLTKHFKAIGPALDYEVEP